MADNLPKGSSVESQSSKGKKILGACLFKMAHLGGRSPQKPKLPPTFLDTSPALASFLTDCLLPELLLAAGIGTFHVSLELTATRRPYTLIISVSYLFAMALELRIGKK